MELQKLTFYKNRKNDNDTLVFVYFNLHKKVFSVKALSGEHKGKVVLHLPSLAIKDAYFVVNETGRQRVLTERKKNVHAGVRGYLALEEMSDVRDYTKQLTYNPYKYKTFVSKETIETVSYAPMAYLSEKQIFVRPLQTANAISA